MQLYYNIRPHIALCQLIRVAFGEMLLRNANATPPYHHQCDVMAVLVVVAFFPSITFVLYALLHAQKHTQPSFRLNELDRRVRARKTRVLFYTEHSAQMHTTCWAKRLGGGEAWTMHTSWLFERRGGVVRMAPKWFSLAKAGFCYKIEFVSLVCRIDMEYAH